MSNKVTRKQTADTGIIQLTGDVTAGPGSGSQAATLNISYKRAAPGFNINNGGSAVTTGQIYGYIRLISPGTITGWSIEATGSSPTCTIDIWKISSGTAVPTVANSIIGAGTKPALTTGNAVRSSNVTSWSAAVVAGDIVAFNLDASANATAITFQLEIVQST